MCDKNCNCTIRHAMDRCYMSAFMSLSVLPNSIPVRLHPKVFTGELAWLCQILEGEHGEQLAVISFFSLLFLHGKKISFFFFNILNMGFPVCFS